MKQPVEWLVGPVACSACGRQTGQRPSGAAAEPATRNGPGAVPTAQCRRLAAAGGWLTTASALARMNASRLLVAASGLVELEDSSAKSRARGRTSTAGRRPVLRPDERTPSPKWPTDPLLRSRRCDLPRVLRTPPMPEVMIMDKPLSTRVSPVTPAPLPGVQRGHRRGRARRRRDPGPLVRPDDRRGQTPLDPGAGVLVMVTLYGGNDGLEHGRPGRRRRLPVGPGRPGLRRVGGARSRRRPRPESGAERSARVSGATGSSPCCAGWAIRSPIAATSGRWRSGRPPRRRRPSPRDGWGAGSTRPGPTRCARYRWTP